ncbi:MAG: choice-of-anchor B family protein [Woeseia sp.]
MLRVEYRQAATALMGRFIVMRAYVLLLFLVLASLAGSPARAHGDDPVLYVAADGDDNGACNTPEAPCRNIGFALRRAGKGTEIRVAGGYYDIDSTETLFHIVAGVVPVLGGHDRSDGFESQSGELTTLAGVPTQYRAVLIQRGFHIIADQKGSGRERAAQTDKLLQTHRQLKSGAAAGPCNGGLAGILPCDNVDLLAHVAFNDFRTRPSVGNDIWGYTDLNTDREYVVAGFNTGTAVLDITDPENPREVGFLHGQSSVWRDMKVMQFYDAIDDRWRAYAYVTTDGAPDGLLIIDLSGLPHSIRRVSYQSDFSTAHNVYITNADFYTGIPRGGDPHLVLAGSNRNAGQIRAYSLADPEAPLLVPNDIPNTFGSDWSYSHDVASLLIDDARKDTQCVNATTTCNVLIDYNEENIEIWDVSDFSDPVRLNPGRQEYAQRGYVHSGWWTEDQQYFFVQDELDEQRSGINTTLRVFSMTDLRNPVRAGTWTGPTTAIDHNGFVRGNRYYMSNYSRGLTVLDISDPTVPVISGFLDTWPYSDEEGFLGAWGAYPYLRNGVIAVSDMDSGLYLLRDNTRDVNEGQLQFSAGSYAAVEGQPASLTVQRAGGSTGDVSVDIEFLHATADPGDYGIPGTTLNWSAGDSSDQQLLLTATDDGVAEGRELLIARLVNPAGGATLGDAGTATIHISDPGAAAVMGLFAATIEVSEQGFGKAVLVVRRDGTAAGPVSVDYAISGGDAEPGADFAGPDAGSLTWADGDGQPKTLEFDIENDGLAESAESFTVMFSNPSGATFTGNTTATVTIAANAAANAAPVAGVSASQSVSANASVTLDGSQSSDPDGDTLIYQWNQLSGPAVQLSAPGAAVTSFNAPGVSSSTTLQFQLRVTDPGGLSDTAETSVTVTAAATDNGGSGGGGGGSAGWLLLLVMLARLSHRSVRQAGCPALLERMLLDDSLFAVRPG